MNERERAIIEDWRMINLIGRPFVLFAHGTCVMPMEPEEDLEAQAIRIMKEHGPVLVGSPAGDFRVKKAFVPPGLLVYYDCPDIVTFFPERCMTNKGGKLSELGDALSARAIRDIDAHELKVLHVESNPFTDGEQDGS